MVSETDMGMQSEGAAEEETPEATSPEEETGTSQAQEAPAEGSKSKPKAGGRRAALRILRESVDNLNKDVSSFRKNHEANSKKLDKQIASLHSEVASLKSHIAKENAKARAKQEALLQKILAKVNTSKPKAALANLKKKGKKSKGK